MYQESQVHYFRNFAMFQDFINKKKSIVFWNQFLYI